MKYLNLNNDFGIDRVANPEEVSDREITLNWLIEVMTAGYPAGLNDDKRRIFVGIFEKTQEARKTKADYLEINPVEYVFIQKAFTDAVIPVVKSKPVTIVETAFLNAVDTIPSAS